MNKSNNSQPPSNGASPQRSIASVSWGKDSLCMLLVLIEYGYQLDEVVFYDTGFEFQAVYDTRDATLPLLSKHGIKYTELQPVRPMLYDMLERPKVKRSGEQVFGDGWCGGPCRWGTFLKLRALNKYIGKNYTYIGFAADEPARLANLEPHKLAPLAGRGITERRALSICNKQGYYWKEHNHSLYDLLDRVSCWCCANKNLKELRNIYHHLPVYWEKLKDLQSKIDRPFKGYYKGLPKGILELEQRFAAEDATNKV